MGAHDSAINEVLVECSNSECPFQNPRVAAMPSVGRGLIGFVGVRCECSPELECRIVTEG
jgi:hypothetical protein